MAIEEYTLEDYKKDFPGEEEEAETSGPDDSLLDDWDGEEEDSEPEEVAEPDTQPDYKAQLAALQAEHTALLNISRGLAQRFNPGTDTTNTPPEVPSLEDQDLVDHKSLEAKMLQLAEAKAAPLQQELQHLRAETMRSQAVMNYNTFFTENPDLAPYKAEVDQLAQVAWQNGIAHMPTTWQQIRNTVVANHVDDIAEARRTKRTRSRPKPGHTETGGLPPKSNGRGVRAKLTDAEKRIAMEMFDHLPANQRYAAYAKAKIEGE